MVRSAALAKAFAATGPEQLALLIGAWNEQPAPALATRIDVVSERLAGGRLDLEGKNLSDLHRACLARIRGGELADLPIIFGAIVKQQSSNAIAEMKGTREVADRSALRDVACRRARRTALLEHHGVRAAVPAVREVR